MTTPKPPLSEKDFIHEGYKKDPFPLWLWLFLLTALLSLIWGSSSWYDGKLSLLVNESPFLQVTNREISLFLWQNPEYMRNNSKNKNGYLPGFQYIDKVTLNVVDADQYAVAPPELLFRYHTWHRLVSGEFTERAIPKKEFVEFLTYAEEWHPTYWPNAPKEYIALMGQLAKMTPEDDLSKLSTNELPLEVRMAFQGWKNYFKEGEAINNVKPTFSQMRKFLASHPHYARNYWQNIVQDTTPNYLKSLNAGVESSDSTVPSDEMSSFLKAAFYNYIER